MQLLGHYLQQLLKEILSYKLTKRKGDVNPYYDGLKEILQLIKKEGNTETTVLHTDQGSVYTSLSYNELIKDYTEITDIDVIPRVFLILSEVKRVLKKSVAKSPKKNTADIIFDFVNLNLFKKISLKQISDTFFISQSQINRIFKKQTGVSVGKYIATKRLLSARHRIHAGEPAVKISEECGYSDYSVFYRAYVNQFGCSPQKDIQKSTR